MHHNPPLPRMHPQTVGWGLYFAAWALCHPRRMKNLIEEFKTFILRGNVVQLAVAVVMGAAFGDVVTGVVEGIMKPLINLIGGSSDISLRLWIFDIGKVLTALIKFLSTAAAVFFVIVKPMNVLMARLEPKKDEKPAGPPPATLDDVVAALKDLKK